MDSAISTLLRVIGVRYGVPEVGLPDLEYAKRVLLRIRQRLTRRTPDLFSIIFGSRHSRVGLALVTILALIALPAGLTNPTKTVTTNIALPQSEITHKAIKSSIVEYALAPMAPEINKDEQVGLMTIDKGVLINQAPVFTTAVKGRLRSDITFYSVKSGETLGGIAKKFDISTGTLIWANKIEDRDSLKIGQNLMILPVSGVLHKVAAKDTVKGIGAKYKTTPEKIVTFNDLDTRPIEPGMLLIVPGGSKALPKQKVVDSGPSWNFWFSGASTSSGASVIGRFWESGGRFSGGYCTSYLQSVKGYIPWLGNARDWYTNSQGYAGHGSTPKKGAIYVEPNLTGWGHVSLVERVNSDGSFLVSEGNYVGPGIISERTITRDTGLFIYF